MAEANKGQTRAVEKSEEQCSIMARERLGEKKEEREEDEEKEKEKERRKLVETSLACASYTHPQPPESFLPTMYIRTFQISVIECNQQTC